MEYKGREMTDRERFEAWYASNAYPMTRPIGWHTNGFRLNHGEYWVGEVQEEWLTWQAATAAAEQDKWAAVRRCAELIHSHSGALYDACHQAKHTIIAEFPEAFK